MKVIRLPPGACHISDLAMASKSIFHARYDIMKSLSKVVTVTKLVLLTHRTNTLPAMRVIRFKSHSQVDNFVLLWNTSYRLANVFFAFFSLSLIEAIKCFKDDPDGFIKLLAKGIIGQSAYLMNLIILATGQETMLQLLQWRSLIKQAVLRPLINLNSRSRRYRDWLNEAPPFEQSFIFGEVMNYSV